MAFTYSTAAKNARLNAVRDLIDADVSAGFLEIGTDGGGGTFGTLLATITFDVTSAPNAAGGVLTFSGFPKTDASAAATGTAAIARIKDGAGVIVIDLLTVGTAATDIILDSVAISTNQDVTLNSMSITHA